MDYVTNGEFTHGYPAIMIGMPIMLIYSMFYIVLFLTEFK